MIELVKRNRRTKLPSHLRDWPSFIRYHMQSTGLKMTGLAQAAGINRSLIYRWLDDEGGILPEVKSVRAICKALDIDARDGLIAAGIFTARELRYGAEFMDITVFTDLELASETMRRMQRHLPTGGAEVELVLADEVGVHAGPGLEEDVVIMHSVTDDGVNNHQHHNGSTSAGAGGA